MRTTITIAPDLLKKTMRISGKKKYSEAIVTSLANYIAMKERLSFLEKLYAKKMPHRLAVIKKLRRKGSWSL